jgi:thiol-disulfide isomerase/thioredoxin
MLPRLSIVAGLLAGVAVAGLVLGAFLFLGPGPVLAPTASPSIAVSPSASALASASTSPSPTATPTTTATSSSAALFHIGELAPALVVPQVGGGTIDLTNLRGQAVWVNFMGTYCPPCRDEFPLMNGFAARYAEAGLVIVAIDVHEDEGTVAGFANELGATFPLGLDVDGSVAADWGAVALPVHFWIDRDGIVRDGALGGIGPDIMAAGLAKILPDVEVTP